MTQTISLDFDTAQLSALVANFYAADAEIQRGALAIVQNAGEAMVEIAQSICPVDTSFMRDHIKARFTEKGYGVSIGWEAEDFESAGLAFYPIYVELGTMKMDPQPTIWPAYDEVAPVFEQDLADLIDAAAGRKSSGVSISYRTNLSTRGKRLVGTRG